MSKKALTGILLYLLFFALTGIITTENVSLFLHLLKNETGIVYTAENIRFAALFTFYNTAFVAAVIAIFDKIRRRIFVENPIKEILSVTKRITHGDFTARVKPQKFGYFKKLDEDINAMAKELSSTEILGTDIISNVSHELKTPLSVLQNYGYLLAEPGLPEEKRIEYAKSMNRATRHLSELVSNILKLSKLESQNLSPVLKRSNISEILCECLLDFENEWDRKNLKLDIDIEEDIYIDTDPDLISIVWTNLVSNAIKFSSDGGTIGVRLRKKGNYVIVSISDTGCGMDKNTMERIFDKFYQGDTSHSIEGNGLGLALVKKVIDILNGDIDVDSIPGEGSTFTVKLHK